MEACLRDVSYLNIIVWDIARPLYSFSGTLHIMASLFTIIQWMDIVESVQASLKFEMRSVSFMKSCSTRVILLLLSLCVIISDLYLSIIGLYGGIVGNLNLPSQIMFAVYLLTLGVFEIWVIRIFFFFNTYFGSFILFVLIRYHIYKILYIFMTLIYIF